MVTEKIRTRQKIIVFKEYCMKQSKTNETTVKVIFIVKNSKYIIIPKLIFFYLFLYFKITQLDGKEGVW